MKVDMLLIERDQDLLDLTVDVLSSFGINVEACNSFHKAIDSLKNSKYDLIMCTHLLDKDKTAQDVYNALTSINAQTNFGILSGAPFEFDSSFLNKLDLIIEKPFDVEKMCLQVKPLIKNKKAQ